MKKSSGNGGTRKFATTSALFAELKTRQIRRALRTMKTEAIDARRELKKLVGQQVRLFLNHYK